jgi:hypothetical protein
MEVCIIVDSVPSSISISKVLHYLVLRSINNQPLVNSLVLILQVVMWYNSLIQEIVLWQCANKQHGFAIATQGFLQQSGEMVL